MEKKFKTIAIIAATIALIYASCIYPVESNYKVRWENDSTGMMKVTYSSLLPFVKRDTIVPTPKVYYGKILTHERITEDNEVVYITVTKVGKEVYRYSSKEAYDYVEQFRIGTDSFKLKEIFWPEHYVKTYIYYLGNNLAN